MLLLRPTTIIHRRAWGELASGVAPGTCWFTADINHASEIARRADDVSFWNRDAGITLYKMQAEAVLVGNLLVESAGLFLIALLTLLKMWNVSLAPAQNCAILSVLACIIVLLIVAVLHRNLMCVSRLKGFHDLKQVSQARLGVPPDVSPPHP